MSLKSFHIIFLIISSLFSIFFGFWSYTEWSLTQDTMYLIFSVCSIVFCLGLFYYSKWFIKEISNLNVN